MTAAGVTAVANTPDPAGDRDPWEPPPQPRAGEEGHRYSAAEIDALTSRAARLLAELRSVLGEIGQRMTALTEQEGDGR